MTLYTESIFKQTNPTAAMKDVNSNLICYPIVILFLLLFSCSRDKDFLYNNINDQADNVEQTDDGSNTGSEDNTESGDSSGEEGENETGEENTEGSNGDDFNTPDNLDNPNSIEGTYYPKSAAEIMDSSRENFRAIISNSFDCSECTFAANQTIEPDGGVISGTNINLNGAYIENNGEQAFSSETNFNGIYELSRLSPDIFGGFSNDGTDDTAAIDAMINNSKYAVGREDGLYLKNAPSIYNRQGTFDWDMNGSKILTNDNSSFEINSFDRDYLFDITNLSPKIYNGEFDGGEVYGRLFWLRGQERYYFADLNIYDYHSTSNARAIAFRINLYPQSYGFEEGEMYRCNIDNIESDSNGIANDVYGLSKGVWMELEETGTANVYFEDNVMTNMKGDDAECVYIAPRGSLSKTNNVHFYLINETYKFAKRRQAKITASNVHIYDSYFEAPGVDQDFNGQAVTMLGIFSTSGENNLNAEVVNCEFVSSGVHFMHALSLTEVENAVIENNTFTFSDIANYVGLYLGGGDANYSGNLVNNSIKNNEFNNCGIQFSSYFTPQEALVMEENTFNYDWQGYNPGTYVGVIRYGAYTSQTVSSEVVFKNSTINYNAQNTFSLFRGVVVSSSSNVQNLTLDNIKVNYTGALPGQVFAHIGTGSSSSFDSSNIIKNCTINGASGSGSITVNGSDKGVVVENSYGDNSSLISVE